MSEEKKLRTSADIQQEYNNLAFKAGNIQHQVYQNVKAVDMINTTLVSLALEYQKVKTAEDAAAAAQAADAANKAATPSTAATEGTAA